MTEQPTLVNVLKAIEELRGEMVTRGEMAEMEKRLSRRMAEMVTRDEMAEMEKHLTDRVDRVVEEIVGEMQRERAAA